MEVRCNHEFVARPATMRSLPSRALARLVEGIELPNVARVATLEAGEWPEGPELRLRRVRGIELWRGDRDLRREREFVTVWPSLAAAIRLYRHGELDATDQQLYLEPCQGGQIVDVVAAPLEIKAPPVAVREWQLV